MFHAGGALKVRPTLRALEDINLFTRRRGP